MQKNLVIVESPAKAKTIEKFLGKDFKVLSSYGHIRDLKKKEFSIDVDKNFKPAYEIPADKKALVNTLKAEAKEAETVWLASDEDRDCTRPADREGFTFLQSTGDNSKPTILSRIRRACCAFTRLRSISRGCSIAFKIAPLVIS